MENASKALLIAGGVLIALLVLGALLLMFSQLSSYQTAQKLYEATDDIAKYNEEYTRYTGNEIQGYELISVINKATNNNTKSSIINSINYDNKVKITIENIEGFKSKYGNSGKTLLIKSNSYTIQNKSDEFPRIIDEFRKMEDTYTLATLNKLSANYDSIKNNSKTIKDIIGKDTNISLEQIAKYREYSEFKTSTFKADESKTQYYSDNGQIKSMIFRFIK